MDPQSDRNVPWHVLPPEECLKRLETTSRGLSATEAARRLAEVGPNEIRSAGRVSAWRILLEQFQNTLIIILLIGVALSAALGHSIEAIAIGVIVLFAALLGFIQEYRAERSMEALRRMAAPMAKVLRDGEEVATPTRELVPGDIVLLHAGDRTPADGRILEAINLQVDEAPLTGESLPVAKQSNAVSATDAPVADRTSMVYAGTAVAYGRGRAVVTATAMETEFGKVAQLLDTVESGQSPLQQNLDKVGKTLTRAALIIVTLIVILGLVRGQPLIEMFIFGIALAVAVVPEALPAVVTISLAIGVQRMVRRNALVRRLPAVETLGSTSVICSDKTGTLTKDEMTVREIFVTDRRLQVTGAGYEPVGDFVEAGRVVEPDGAVRRLLEAGALASDAHIARDKETDRWEIHGDPTEGAVIVAAAKAGLRKTELDVRFPRIQEIPFSSETKRMTTLHETPRGVTAYVKGAPEVVIDLCTRWMAADGPQPLDATRRANLLGAARSMAESALRVLAIAERTDATLVTAERDLTFLGLVGMIDPPRPEAQAAVRQCEEAGIKVIMITGDHPITAQAVARELGLLKRGRVVTGAELERMSDSDLKQQVEEVEVFARVSPAHKLRVVTALQERGHVAAMTGDGVNDAPALKKAAIGIAMGITGADVTKEAASMTLTDDNFASIVAAVEEGRGIFGNIKKYLMYLLSANIGEIGIMAGASALGMPLPLSAVQLLYVNLATDGLPALALAVDPPDHDVMRQPPRDPRTGVFTRHVVALMTIGGLWSMFVNLSLFAWAQSTGHTIEQSMTLTFVTLVMMEFFKAYNFRSENRSAWIRPLANKWLNLAIVWELILLVFVIHVPWLNGPFRTAPLAMEQWFLCAIAAASICPVLELAKWISRYMARHAGSTT